MFIFSTNTIINEFAGYPGGFIVDDALLTRSGNDADLTAIKGQKVRWYVDKTDENDPILRIGRDFRFASSNVVAIYKRECNDPELAKVEIDLAAIVDPGFYRIAIYVRLSQGSQDSYYANDFVFKGKPFFVEFKVTQADVNDKVNLAKKIVRIVKKYMNMQYEYPLLTVTADQGKVYIEATDEYQRFKIVELQQLGEGFNPDCCHALEVYEAIDSLDPQADAHQGYITFVAAADGHLLKGKEGFGTYRQITKDLRLPTGANNRWNGIVRDDMPQLGGKYDEYIIYMCVNRGVMGSDAVGDLVKSRTHHVFYVLHDECEDIIETWEKALLQIAPEIEVVNKDKDDTELANPFDSAAATEAIGETENTARTEASGAHEETAKGDASDKQVNSFHGKLDDPAEEEQNP